MKAFTTRQYSRATSRSSPIGPSTGCSFINKTRIKTSAEICRWRNNSALQDHIPTKQGLRLLFLLSVGDFAESTRPYPNKTRIKTKLDVFFCLWVEVLQDHIPTKQGLRLIFRILPSFQFAYKTISQQNKD